MTGALTAAVGADVAGVRHCVTLKRCGALASAQDAILLGDACTSCKLDVTGTGLSGSSMGGHTVEISASATGSQATLRQVDVLGDVSVTADASSLSISDSTIKEIGAESRGTINFSGGALDVTNSTITLNADNFGVNFAGQTLTLTTVTINGGKYGVYQLAGNVMVRSTKILDYGFMGYYLAQGRSRSRHGHRGGRQRVLVERDGRSRLRPLRRRRHQAGHEQQHDVQRRRACPRGWWPLRPIR